MKNIIPAIVLSLAITACAASYYLTQTQTLKDSAIQGCIEANQVTVSSTDESGITSTYTKPMEQFFKLCVEDKGYQTAVELPN